MGTRPHFAPEAGPWQTGAMKRGWMLAVLLAAGCGARTPLDFGPSARDAGTHDAPSVDAPVDLDAPSPTDAAPDVPVPVDAAPDAPPILDVGPDAPAAFALACSPPQMIPFGDATRIAAEVLSGSLAAGRWRVVEAPGEVRVVSPSEPATMVVPSAAGGYRFAFDAVSTSGEEATCETFVAVLDGDPVASCPGETIVVPVGEVAAVEGLGFDAEGPVRFQWEVVGLPPGATFRLFEPATDPVAMFQPGTAGSYTLRLTVTDTAGNQARCRASVRAIAPPELECPGTIRAPTRQPVTLTVPGRDDTAIVEHRWAGISWPFDDDGVEFESIRGNSATFVPRRRGNYVIEYTAVDDDGLQSSCRITVVATPTPPTLMCPDEVVIPPLTTGEIEATVEDDGDVRVRWTLVSSPEGSGASDPSPAGSLLTRFTPDIAGEYELRIVARDDDGMTAECTTRVMAVSDEGLRIEMFWDSDRTDMDLHLINPEATRWFNSSDCYYANCIGGLMWGMPGTDDDPSLDIDDRDGLGPENTNIEVPYAGTYRVGVHAWSGEGAVTVRVYCGGSRTDPVAEYGPVRIASSRREFWRVADVAITGAGRCTVTELLRDDGTPDVTTRDAVEAGR